MYYHDCYQIFIVIDVRIIEVPIIVRVMLLFEWLWELLLKLSLGIINYTTTLTIVDKIFITKFINIVEMFTSEISQRLLLPILLGKIGLW